MTDAPSLTATIANTFGNALASPLDPTLVVALTVLATTALVTLALLRAWQDWIELKRREIENGASSKAAPEETMQMSTGAARIELADMKERIKKLEAIASGVEL